MNASSPALTWLTLAIEALGWTLLHFLWQVAFVAFGADVAQQRTPETDRTATSAAKATAELKPATSKDKPDDVITIRGQVLRPDGRTAAGAKVSAVRSFWGAPWRSLVTSASAGVSGEFEIRIPKSQPDEGRPSQGAWIVAEAPGFGVEWTGLGMRKLDPSKPVVLKLVPEFAIHGRVVDSEGKPIRDVRVKVMEQNTPNDGEDLGRWLQAVKSENRFAANRLLRRRLYIFDDETPSPIATDQDGRFVLGGIGPERVAHLELRGEKIAYTQIDVVTRAIKPIARKTEPGVTDQVFGADFTYAAQPTRPIVGTVLEAGTGRPLAGMRIESGPLPGALLQPRGVATETDAHGKYRLVGLPKRKGSRRGRGNEIAVVPNDVQPYFMSRMEVPDTPGFEPVTLNIELTRGLWILGEVTDKATGRPVPSRLTYYPFLSNPFAQKSPQFRQSFMTGSSHSIGDNMRYLTRSDGTFRLVGLPGRGIVAADALPWAARPTPFALGGLYRKGVGASEIAGMDKDGRFPTYRNMETASSKRNDALKEINPPAGTPAVICNLVLDTGGTLRIKLVDRDGKPVDRCLINQTTAKSHVITAGGSLDSTFDLTGLSPNEPETLIICQPERKIGKVLTVSYDEKAPRTLTVTLEPCATVKGRVVDADGVPVKGLLILASAHGDFGSLRAPGTPVVCDAGGRFLCANLAPGCDYYSLQALGGGFAGDTVVEKLVIAAGKTIDLGDVKVKRRSGDE